MEKTMNSAVRRVITVILTMLMVLGISMLSYACYAVEECEQIDSYFPAETGQPVYSADCID